MPEARGPQPGRSTGARHQRTHRLPCHGPPPPGKPPALICCNGPFLREWCHRYSWKSLDQQDCTVSGYHNPQGVYYSLELSDEVVLVQQWHMSVLTMRQCSAAAGSLCKLCASECAERVQRAAACCAGGCHARLPAILAWHPTREADSVQDQCQDLGLRHRLQPYVNVQL